MITSREVIINEMERQMCEASKSPQERVEDLHKERVDLANEATQVMNEANKGNAYFNLTSEGTILCATSTGARYSRDISLKMLKELAKILGYSLEPVE